LYGPEHPYGRYSVAEDYQALQREDLLAFFDRYYRKGACRIMIAGKLPENIIPLLEASFGKLPLRAAQKGAAGGTPVYPIHPAVQKKYAIDNDPNGVQGSI